ncbi:ribonuclease domain-containing protein [Crossiella sp. CA-258035]|uniref:ribonuclease domain-containing protein n=1 Tax=Crossiella sp. CA-258035 TaxID=2981138 RepID=UPI0024BCBC9C|nr:ribonuclease domain-containing protein [Crossiella sp. CA-258035]WHT20880.1 ribonuclease domain-containing protein [Crossiella sp. CA-258035]
MTSRKRITLALAGLIALVLVGWLGRDLLGGNSAAPPSSSTGAAVSTSAGKATRAGGDVTEALSKLPAEAAKTWKLIQSNGPFPYPDRDGVEFQNREKRLPAQGKGYYREYTVPTPGERTRGARRLVTGSGKELYYTGDHYETFVKVDPNR